MAGLFLQCAYELREHRSGWPSQDKIGPAGEGRYLWIDLHKRGSAFYSYQRQRGRWVYQGGCADCQKQVARFCGLNGRVQRQCRETFAKPDHIRP